MNDNGSAVLTRGIGAALAFVRRLRFGYESHALCEHLTKYSCGCDSPAYVAYRRWL